MLSTSENVARWPIGPMLIPVAHDDVELELAQECADESAQPSPKASHRGQSGYMGCQCQLRVEVDGELVRTCGGFDIKPRQRSVSLAGFSAPEIMAMLKALGYDFRDDKDKAKAELITASLVNEKSSSKYRFSLFHFSSSFLKWTACHVKFSTDKRSAASFWPNIPAELVYYRTRLYREAYALDADRTSTQSFADAVQPTRTRAHPDDRERRAAERDLAQVLAHTSGRGGATLGKRDPQRTPSSAQPPEKTTRQQESVTGAVLRQGARLLSAFDQVAEATAARGDAALRAADAAMRTAAAEAEAAQLKAEREAERAAAAAMRTEIARLLRLRALELADQARMEKAHDAAIAQATLATANAAKWRRWHTDMLAPGSRLAKLCPQLTSFASLETFRLWFDIVCDHQEDSNPELRGLAWSLDYYYAPKHAPPVELGQPIRPPLDAAAALAAARNRWSAQLSPAAPGGLDSPFEACFMTLAMMRLGLTVAEAAALFALSTGSVSQIFHTWLPYLHECMTAWTPWPERDLVQANLPKKFTAQLAQVTHSKNCHVIFDCTEVRARTACACAPVGDAFFVSPLILLSTWLVFCLVPRSRWTSLTTISRRSCSTAPTRSATPSSSSSPSRRAVRSRSSPTASLGASLTTKSSGHRASLTFSSRAWP